MYKRKSHLNFMSMDLNHYMSGYYVNVFCDPFLYDSFIPCYLLLLMNLLYIPQKH